MADARDPEPVIFFTSVISRYASARAWAIDRLAERFGVILCRTEPMPFVASGYYRAEMGDDLQKVIVAFAEPVDPVGLADWKLWTNQLEAEFAAQCRQGIWLSETGEPIPQPRPLNLDSGYVTQAKFVLATTKDRDHRIYLRDGIFAEVTLSYTRKEWKDHRWTYPDYRTGEVARFAETCRLRLREHLADTRRWRAQPGVKGEG